MVLLRRSPSRMKSADLAVALGATAGFVPQVMAPLVRAGWVRSVPGPTGGYEAVVVLDGLSVLEIVEEVDGPTETGRCVVADRPCDAATPCVMHAAWNRARRDLMASLAGLSLAAVSAPASMQSHLSAAPSPVTVTVAEPGNPAMIAQLTSE
jgi:Rrf2 family protein